MNRGDAGADGAARATQPATQRSSGSTQGFQGAIENMPLVDLLQVWSVNAFSGLVTVTSSGRTGLVYFVDGEVVHAEADDLVGEPAVRRIIGWVGGSFELHPNTTTLHRTIDKRLGHLLLDAHREIDEERRDTPPPATAAPVPRPPPPSRPPAPPARPPAVVDQLRAIRGVTALVRFGADGRPVGPAVPDAEALAAKGLYLAMMHGGAAAQAFGLNELAFASVGGGPEAFVVVHSGAQYLCLAVSPEVPIELVCAQVRGAFRAAARPA